MSITKHWSQDFIYDIAHHMLKKVKFLVVIFLIGFVIWHWMGSPYEKGLKAGANGNFDLAKTIFLTLTNENNSEKAPKWMYLGGRRGYVISIRQLLLLIDDLEYNPTAITTDDAKQLFKGALLIWKQKPEQAEKILNDLTTRKPDIAAAHYALAGLYTGQVKGPRAISEYNKTIALDPNEKRAYFYLGNVAYNTGNYELALRATQKALKMGKWQENEICFLEASLGLSYYQLKNWSLALKHFERRESMCGNDPQLSNVITKSRAMISK